MCAESQRAKKQNNTQISQTEEKGVEQPNMSKLDIVKQYQKARQDEDLDTILGMVADNIKFVSSRDGTFEGKEAFSKYLHDNKSPPKSEWEEVRCELLLPQTRVFSD